MKYKKYEVKPVTGKRIGKGSPVEVWNKDGFFIDTKENLAAAKSAIDKALKRKAVK